MEENTWPEQEEIDSWWKKHQFDLKNAVTKARIRVQSENETLKATLAQMREAIEKLLPKVSCDSIACQPRCLCGAEKISESGRKLLSQTQDIAAQQEAKLLRAEIKGIENCPVASWDKQTMITELSKQADRLEEKK